MDAQEARLAVDKLLEAQRHAANLAVSFALALGDVPDAMLANLRAKIEAEMQRRKAASPDAQPVIYSLTLTAGNERAGAKTWVKILRSIDPARPNGYGLLGDWTKDEGALPAGTLLIVGGRGGTWKNQSSLVVLLRIKSGAQFEKKSGYQAFAGEGVELIASDTDEVDVEAALTNWPDLASVVGRQMAPIFVAARKLGL